MIVEKEMFLDVDGKQVGMEMIECEMAVSSRSDAACVYVCFYAYGYSTSHSWNFVCVSECVPACLLRFRGGWYIAFLRTSA